MAAHLEALVDATGRGAGADGARPAVVVGAVGLGATGEVVALHGAREALPLGDGDDVDELALGEDLADRQLLADRVAVRAVEPELPDRLDPRQVLQLTGERPGELPALARTQLDGGVAVPLVRPQPGHGVGGDLDDRDGDHRPVRLEDLCHADLAADEANRVLAHGQTFSARSAEVGARRPGAPERAHFVGA